MKKNIYAIALYSRKQKKYNLLCSLSHLQQDIGWGIALQRTFFMDKQSAIAEAKKYGVPCRAKVWTYTFKEFSENFASKTMLGI